MTFVRPARRVLIAAASLSALLVAAACGGGDNAAPESGDASAGVDLTKIGPIDVYQGKDTSGNFPKLVAQFNAANPDGKVTFKELPDEADAQRQLMIQNTQIKNPTMGVLSVDVVWTAEFAAKDYIVELPPDQFPTQDFLPATVASGTYFNKLYAYPVACSTTARTCWRSTTWSRRPPSTR